MILVDAIRRLLLGLRPKELESKRSPRTEAPRQKQHPPASPRAGDAQQPERRDALTVLLLLATALAAR